MTDLGDLERAWSEGRDGEAGHEYGMALERSGRIAQAAEVYQALIDDGYLIGYYDLAWLEHDRGDLQRAQSLLEEYLSPLNPGDENSDLAAGVLGHWRWDQDRRVDAEPLLRRGANEYPSARADLAHLLIATDRADEAEQVLRVGVELGDVGSHLPLANLLESRGDVGEAIDLLERGYALGDAHSAYNLYVLLRERDAEVEARVWLWRAAEGGDEVAIGWLVESSELFE